VSDALNGLIITAEGDIITYNTRQEAIDEIEKEINGYDKWEDVEKLELNEDTVDELRRWKEPFMKDVEERSRKMAAERLMEIWEKVQEILRTLPEETQKYLSEAEGKLDDILNKTSIDINEWVEEFVEFIEQLSKVDSTCRGDDKNKHSHFIGVKRDIKIPYNRRES
jgi:uncharacterized Zn finger protein